MSNYVWYGNCCLEEKWEWGAESCRALGWELKLCGLAENHSEKQSRLIAPEQIRYCYHFRHALGFLWIKIEKWKWLRSTQAQFAFFLISCPVDKSCFLRNESQKCMFHPVLQAMNGLMITKKNVLGIFIKCDIVCLCCRTSWTNVSGCFQISQQSCDLSNVFPSVHTLNFIRLTSEFLWLNKTWSCNSVDDRQY